MILYLSHIIFRNEIRYYGIELKDPFILPECGWN
jgi:hypothetical protein